MPPHIPPELSDRIIDHLHDDPSALSACGLTCRTWVSAARCHRFSALSIRVPRLGKFLHLLENSPVVGIFVQDLTLGQDSSGLTHRLVPRVQLISVAKALPVVKHFRTKAIIWGPNYRDLGEYWPLLQTVSAIGCFYQDAHDLLSALASFPRLTSFIFRSPHLIESSVRWDWNLSPLRPPLKILELTNVPNTAHFCRWLSNTPSQARVETFESTIGERSQAISTKEALREFGESMTNLSLTVDSYASVAAIFKDTHFTLADCPRLRAFRLQLYIHGPCSNSDPSLLWVSDILQQITSLDIEEITLTIFADPMLDLVGLDSECGVRPLSLTTFDDLIVLPWRGINHIFSTWTSRYLQVLSLRAKGPTATLDAYLASGFPQVRKLVRFIRP